MDAARRKELAPLAQLARQARQAVAQAGRIVRENWRRPKAVRYKGPRDLLTETDLAVEQALAESLPRLLPGSALMGEETTGVAALSRPTWIVDPVDGTTNFAHGLPMVATSVGLWDAGRIVLGIVHLPVLREMFWAVRGQGAYLGSRRIRVSQAPDLARALVATGFPYDIPKFLPDILRQLGAALPLAQGVRRMGAASVDLAYVACGRYDAFFEFALNPWDTAAGVLLIEEAGGRVGTMTGQEPYRLGGPDILTANGLLFAQLQSLLKAAAATAP